MAIASPPRDEVLVQRLQAVAEETRLAIVRLLGSGERCVCDLQADLGAGQSRLSFHLRKLKDAGLVEDRREGRWVYYRLVPQALDELSEVFGGLTHGAATGCGDDGCGCGIR